MAVNTSPDGPVPQSARDLPVFLRALNAALAEKDAARAFALCRGRVKEAPGDPDAHRHLAVLLAMDGATKPAVASAKRACELSPDDPRCWCDLGRVYAIAGDFENASLAFSEAIVIDVRFADAWHNLGIACRKLGKRQEAFTAFRNALLIDPTRAETYLSLATLLVDAGQFEDALEALERAAKHDPAMPKARIRLANRLSQKRNVKRAEKLFRLSLGMDPDHIEGWLGLARTLEDLGEAEGARDAYLNVLRRRPDHALALGNFLAIVPKAESAAAGGVDWLDYAETALRNAHVKDDAKALIGYGLLKFHDQRDNIEAAAQAGTLANASRRRMAGPLDRAALAARIDNLIRTYTSEFFSQRRKLGLGTDQPVFIVGLPRSGTTLTEQILSAHPLLHGAGELPDLGRLATSLLGEDDAPWQAAALLDENRSRALAGNYLKALRCGAAKGRMRISDKSPLNFFQLAFAALLFPHARVVHCTRDVRDNALSIWMQNFAPDQTYATDFADLAFFQSQYARLMEHWRRELPLQILDVRYEDTISDLETRARELVDFLGAPWDRRCLDFHAQTRAVQTPSRWQVRRPIYSSSVGRWKLYADYLPGLHAHFADVGA
jgi:cytochrome c-type biogenesis protein CcmH/NrfG